MDPRLGPDQRDVDGNPQSAATRPLSGDGDGGDDGRFGCYAAALGALDRPGIFEDRACYRLLDADAAPGAASLSFGEGRYFEVINVGEAVAHEYAAARHGLGRDPARPAGAGRPAAAGAGRRSSRPATGGA